MIIIQFSLRKYIPLNSLGHWENFKPLRSWCNWLNAILTLVSRTLAWVANIASWLRQVCPSVCPHVSSRLALDGFFCEIWCWRLLRKSVHELQISVKVGTKTSGALHRDLSTFILLTAVRSILYLDSSAKGTHCCIPMATLNILHCWQIHVFQQEFNGNALCRFHGNSGYADIINALTISF